MITVCLEDYVMSDKFGLRPIHKLTAMKIFEQLQFFCFLFYFFIEKIKKFLLCYAISSE